MCASLLIVHEIILCGLSEISSMYKWRGRIIVTKYYLAIQCDSGLMKYPFCHLHLLVINSTLFCQILVLLIEVWRNVWTVTNTRNVCTTNGNMWCFSLHKTVFLAVPVNDILYKDCLLAVTSSIWPPIVCRMPLQSATM